jgi:hypothetical protein
MEEKTALLGTKARPLNAVCPSYHPVSPKHLSSTTNINK